MGSVPSSLLGPGGFCIGRGVEVSEDVTPTPGSWPKGLDALAQPAEPLNNLGAISFSKNLSVWVQGRQEWPQAAETVVACSECVIMGRIPRPAVHSVLPHLSLRRTR